MEEVEEPQLVCKTCGNTYPSIRVVSLLPEIGHCPKCRFHDVRFGILPCLHLLCVDCLSDWHVGKMEEIASRRQNSWLAQQQATSMVVQPLVEEGSQRQALLTTRAGHQPRTTVPNTSSRGSIQGRSRPDNTDLNARPKRARQNEAPSTKEFELFHDAVEGEIVRQDTANRSRESKPPPYRFNLNK